jgi:hypothetical protein
MLGTLSNIAVLVGVAIAKRPDALGEPHVAVD